MGEVYPIIIKNTDNKEKGAKFEERKTYIILAHSQT